jgi:hypothetical protein
MGRNRKAMTKNGKSVQPNTGKRGTRHAKASEPTQRRKPLESKSGSQKQENLERLVLDYLGIDYSLDENLEQCRQKGEIYQKYARRSHKALYEALVPIYEAPIKARANDGVDELRSKIISLYDHKATKASILHNMMISIYLAVDQATASIYGAALDFAQAKGIKSNQLIEFLKENKGVYECAEEFKFSDLNPKKKPRRKSKVSSNKPVPPVLLEAHGNPVTKWGPKSLSNLDKLRQEKKEGEAYLKVKFKEDGTIFVCHCSSSPINSSPLVKKTAKQRPSSSVH